MVFVLPYDGSAVAQVALAHLVCRMRRHGGSDQVLLALVVTRRHELERLLAQARALAGAGVPLGFRLIPEDDLHGAFARLRTAVPEATFVAPVGPTGPIGWYYVAVRNILAGWFGRTLALHLQPARQRSGPARAAAQPDIPVGTPRWGGCAQRVGGRSTGRRAGSAFEARAARPNGAGEE